MSQRESGNRVTDHPILGPLPARHVVSFSFDGQPLTAHAGEILAAALLAHGIRALSVTDRERKPRGLYCAIGHCFECQVTVDDRARVRACLTPVRDGMRVTSGGPVSGIASGLEHES